LEDSLVELPSSRLEELLRLRLLSLKIELKMLSVLPELPQKKVSFQEEV